MKVNVYNILNNSRHETKFYNVEFSVYDIILPPKSLAFWSILDFQFSHKRHLTCINKNLFHYNLP